MNWRDLKKRGITVLGGAVSGGLDSCTIVHWLNSKGFSIECFTVDLGQPDEQDLSTIVQRLLNCGAAKASIISGQEALAEAGLKIIQAQARYEGGYWNTTGVARPVTVDAILPELRARDISVLFHGATGRGNDQVRFQIAANMLDPDVEIYAPWRDPEFVSVFSGRRKMIEYCRDHGLPIKSSDDARYSTDANFLGLTHEAGDLENVKIPPDFVKPEMGVWPWDAPDEYQTIKITWEKGRPVAINDETLDLVDIFKKANQLAGCHGVGIGSHVVENRFVGVKSRGIYEAPGVELLGSTYEFLLQFILDRRARDLHDILSKIISLQIYQGYWMDLSTTAALAAIKTMNRLVTGTISVRLYKGTVNFEAAEDTIEGMPNSLYTEDSSMEDIGTYDHVDAEGLLKILTVSARNVGNKQFPEFNR